MKKNKNPTKTVDFSPNSSGIYPKVSTTTQMFKVLYSNKPLVKNVYILMFTEIGDDAKTTYEHIYFQNKNRMSMSGKIRTRIKYDS